MGIRAKRSVWTMIMLLGCLVASPSHARVFSFADESFAPYFGVRGGLSSLGSQPYEWQSSTSHVGDEFDLAYGGEFGIYLRGSSLGLAVGILVHTFDGISSGRGSNASGDLLYSAEVEALGYGANLLFDYQFAQTPIAHWKLVFGGGYMFRSMESTYTFSATGQALVGGQASLSETYKSDSPFAVLAVGTEFFMSGTTTLQLMLGYHYSFNSEWKYAGGGQNLAGSHASGGPLVNEDASLKKMDWSYPYLQLNFQFYVDNIR